MSVVYLRIWREGKAEMNRTSSDTERIAGEAERILKMRNEL